MPESSATSVPGYAVSWSGPLGSEWVRGAFPTDGGLRTMTGEDENIVVEGHHLVAHRLDEPLKRPTGKIGPTDAAGEELVATE